jgi:hypothetical protein
MGWCNLHKINLIFLISNFRLALKVVCFLLGDSLASEFYMPAFRDSHHKRVEMKNDEVKVVGRQRTYNLTMMRVRATIVVVEKQ